MPVDVFLSIMRVLGLQGDCDGEYFATTDELLAYLKTHPDACEMQMSMFEYHWTHAGRDDAQALVRWLVTLARHLSDLAGGDVPFLTPREVVEASVGVARPTDADALLIGKTVQRSIRTQMSEQSAEMTQTLLAQMERLLAGHSRQIIPAESKYLDTRQMAERLGLDEVTVARHCKRGKIDADKTAGNQWRTTEDRLRRSPYMNRKNGKRRGGSNGQLE